MKTKNVEEYLKENGWSDMTEGPVRVDNVILDGHKLKRPDGKYLKKLNRSDVSYILKNVIEAEESIAVITKRKDGKYYMRLYQKEKK